MRNDTIMKLLELLEENNKEEIKSILMREMLSVADKKRAKVYTTVSKYLKQIDQNRLALKGIQHKNGKQFICDGYTLHIFNEYKMELDALPQTSVEESLNYPQIYDRKNYNFNEQDDEDKFIFANIKKYINFVKTKQGYNKKDRIIIIYHDMLFDTKLLDTAIDLHQNDLDTIQVAYNKTNLVYKGKEVDSLILPLRPIVNDTERLEQNDKYRALLDEFKRELNG